MSATASARRAEALAARLPPLLVAAERVAATVAQGVHGRRRVGQGDSFWQFRPFLAGDPVGRIDWRQSAKTDRTFIRETEWEAAQTVCLWRDASASMRWRSRAAPVEKIARAELLTLALAALLLRGGERVKLIGAGMRPLAGRSALDAIAAAIQRRGEAEKETGTPADFAQPRHARAVLMGDFLGPLPEIQAAIGRFAAIPLRGHVLQILDPAEEALPYEGRVRFEGLEREGETLISRVDGVRDAYARKLAAQQDGLRAACQAAGWSFAVHRTDGPPEAALMALYTALAPVR